MTELVTQKVVSLAAWHSVFCVGISQTMTEKVLIMSLQWHENIGHCFFGLWALEATMGTIDWKGL